MIRPPPRSTRTATPFPTRRSSDLAVTIAVLDEVADVLGRGTYTRNISRALRENETHLREMLFETMRQDPKAGRLSRLPFYKDITEALVDAGFRLVDAVLAEPHTAALAAYRLLANLQQDRRPVNVNHATA